MVLSLNAFIKEPEKYPSVFTDGSKPKIVKANIKYENEVAQFILENNLETIFQKMYYQIVLNEVVDKMKKANVFLGLERSPIGETHGNAEFSIRFPFKINEILFDLSFQNGTLKFALSRNYGINNTEGDIHYVQQWTDELRHIGEDYGYNKFNDSKGRARIAVSKKISDSWPKITKEEVATSLVREFSKFREMAEKSDLGTKSVDG